MFSKFQDKLMQILMPIANKIEQQKHLQAIKDGMVGLIPIIIIGSFSLIPLAIANLLGSGVVYDFLTAHMSVFTYASMFSSDMISIYAAMFIANALAKSYGIHNNQTAPTAILVHLILCGLSIEGGLSISYLGSSGLFTSIISGIMTVFIGRRYISVGTLIYFIPYGTFVSIGTKIYEALAVSDGMLIRILFSVVGCLILYLGIAICIVVDIGVDPCTGIVLVIRDKLKKEYRYVKIAYDIFIVVLGAFLGGTLGVVTIITALLAGPIIQFYCGMLERVFRSKV